MGGRVKVLEIRKMCGARRKSASSSLSESDLRENEYDRGV